LNAPGAGHEIDGHQREAEQVSLDCGHETALAWGPGATRAAPVASEE
jgi:hypothetical protein